MRVLFVTHAYPRHPSDAAGSFLHRLAVALRASDVDVQVLAPSGPDLRAEESIDGVPIRRFRYAPRGMESLAYTGTMAEQVLGSLKGKGALAGLLAAGSVAVHREIERLAPDVVHAHWWFPAGLLAVGGAGDVPFITTMHGSDVRLARKVKMVHPLFRKVMRSSKAITAVSSWLAGEARAMAPDTSIRIAPMPADTALFRADATARVPGRFVFVGRLNAQKGLADLLDALSWVPEATLEVLGTGDDAATLRAQAERLGVSARVSWRGQIPRSELPTVYRSAQAVVMPSRNEGLGLVAVEAQLCGTPVIAYNSGGLPDVVSPEWGGTLVTAGDTRHLAEAMRSALERSDSGSGRGAAARARMLDRFAPSAVASGYRETYRAVIAGG